MVSATLTTFGSTTPGTTIWFDKTGATEGETYAFALPVDVSALSTGYYDWEVELTQYYDGGDPVSVTITGNEKVINTLGSSMATGWFPFGVSSLVWYDSDNNGNQDNYDDVMLMQSGMQRFQWDGTEWVQDTIYDTSAYTLTGTWGSSFTLTAKDGTEQAYYVYQVDANTKAARVDTITDPNDNVTSYTYYSSTSGKVTGIEEPSGEETTFAYDGNGYLATSTSPDGILSTYTVDANGRITAIAKPDPDGPTGPLSAPTTTLEYDATTGLLTSITSPDGGVETYDYDHALRLAKVTHADGTEDTYTSLYASALVDTSSGVGTTQGNPADLIGAGDIQVTATIAGVTTTADVDDWGFATAAVSGEGDTTLYYRNINGQVTKKIEPDPDDEGPLASSVTTYDYDAKGNLIRTTLPDGSTRTWVYDSEWNVPVEYADESGTVTYYLLDDDNGNVLSEIVVVGNYDLYDTSESDDLVTTYTYTDSNDGTIVGLVETVTDPTGTVTAYQYNSRGQKTTITYDSGGDLEATVEYEYDSTSGELLAETDELGRRTEYVYDNLNRLTHTVLPAADTMGTTIDNSDASGFWTNGSWSTVGSQIVASGSAGSPDATATWEFTDLDSDKYYEVFVSWTADASYATDAPFSIYDGNIDSDDDGEVDSGISTFETIDVDQTDSSADSKLLGSGWLRLGTYAVDSSTLSVLLTNDAAGSVAADSVLILEHSCTESVYDDGGRLIATIDEAGRTTRYGYDARGRQTHTYTEEADATGAVVDDGDANFSASPTASWTTNETSGEGSDLRYAASGTGGATATWTFDDLDPNQRYVVLVTWTADATNNATDAPYSVYDGTTSGTLLDTINVDQQVRPAILGLLDANWESLGTFTPSGDTLTIQLTNDADGRVIADSVRVVEASALSETIFDTAGNVIGTVDTLGNITEYEYDNDGRQTKTYAPYSDLDGAVEVDNGDSSVTLYYASPTTDPDSVDGDYVTLTHSSGYARYVVPDIEAGKTYEVWVSYPADAGTVTATYDVYDGWKYENDLLATYTVDQTEQPSGSAVFGENWHYLGMVTAGEDYLTVDITGGIGVLADAVTIAEARAVTEYVYDSAGRVYQTIDAYGNATEYVYDTSDRVIQTISADPDGDGELESSVSYTHYDSSGRVSGTIDPVGSVSTTEYDILGRVEATYSGQVIGSTDDAYAETAGTWSAAEGGLHDAGYRTAATVQSATATATATWTFENLMIGEEYEIYVCWEANEDDGSPDAHFSVYKGSTSGTLLYQEDVDQSGDPTEESDFLDFSSSSFEKLTSFTLSSGDSTTLVVTLSNDGATAGKLVLADAVYLVRSTAMNETEYDEDGQLASTTDALGNETSYDYDVLGRSAGVTQADPDGEGDLESPYLWRHYDAAGQVIATVAADMAVSSTEYDGRGRAVATYSGTIVDDSSDSGFETTGSWDPATDGGLLDTYQTADSVVGTATATATWTFENLIVGDDYDIYITWTYVTGGADDVPAAIYLGSTGETATWTGDINQSAAPTDASGLISFSDQAFAQLGSTITLTDSTLIVQLANNTGETGEVISIDAVYVVRADAMSQYVYDNDGLLTTTIDADGNETSYTYDALGRVTAVTQPDPDGTGTDYDAPVYRTYYNSAGQTSASLSPDGATTTYGYDDFGRQTTTLTGQTITPAMGDYDEPSGTWTTVSGGLLDSYQTIASVTGTATATATWTFTDLVPGEEYDVYISWTANGANTGDAHFSVYLDSTSGTLVYDDTVDQTLDPDQPADFAGLGTARFELLTSYELHEDDATTLVVELSNLTESTGGTIVADAVYLVRKGADTENVYDFAGRLVATLDADGNQTDYTYDNLGRTTVVTLPDPDGDGPLTRPTTEYVYDAASRVIETIQYEGEALDYDQRGPEFYRVLDDSVDIGAYEGLTGPETSTYVVDTLVDESDDDYSTGDLSLREAIYLASQNAGHDLITFDASLSGTMSLTLGQLVIDSDLTIEGPGAGTLTIDADDASRIFYITGDVTAILSGMTLTDGYATYGGAVYTGSGSDVTLRELTVSGNTASNYGGGVFTGYAESLVIESCTITSNDSGYYGGGVAGYSDRVYIYDTTVSENKAVRYGAGVAFYYETLEMVDCVVSDNVFSSDTYSGYGAGLFLYGGAVTTITGTTIENNQADAAGEYSAAYGGAIATINGAATYLVDCTISGNEATVYGGGIYSLEGTFDISSTTIEGNVAGSWGGGVCGHFDTLTISDSLLVDNEAVRGGGLIAYSADALLTNVTVSGNSASHVGGGVYFYGSDDFSARLVGCTITDNTGLYAGGIYRAALDVRLDNTIVADNTATLYPDLYGTYNENSSNNLIGNNDGLTGITNNERGNQVGTSASPIDPMLDDLAYNGGPTMTHMPQTGSPVLDAGSTLLGTTYYDGRGENYYRTIGVATDVGAVEYNSLNLLVDELTDGTGMTLEEAITAANASPGADTITFSAGLDLSSAIDIVLSAEIDITGDLTIIGPGADELAISGNDAYRIFDLADGIIVRLVGLTLTGGAATGAGGAIRSLAEELTLEDCQILDSSATTDGGAIYATGTLNLLESTVAGNSATDGGAIMLDGAAAFIRQSTIAENSATDGAGIALANSATATILQSTIALNTATGNGGGIDVDSGNVLMHNTLVADNSAGTDGPDIDGALLAGSSYNLVSDSSGLTGIDITLDNQLNVDALLGELDYNGGPTQTIPLRVDSPALDAGNDDLALTRLGRSSSTVYDSLGRVVQQISIDPDGIGSEEASVTSYSYDANGNLLTETDPLGNVTEYEYDNLGRKTSETDPEEGVTSYTYDDLGRMASLTDPEENTTYWSYSPLGQVATETINVDSTDLVRYYSYDARGNLTRKIDRNGRVIDYAYDSLSRLTTETWYDDVTDADAQQDAVTTYSTTYDEMGRVATIGDGDYDFEYTWSIFGNLTSTTQDLTGLSDDVVFNYTYDVLGRQTSVAATVGSTEDYVNTYSYDNLGRITQITQDGVSGGNAVAEKRVDYAYNDDSTRATISRYADLAGTTAVAETEKVFDELGRVTDIVHERAVTEFADYDLAWDAADELTDFDFESLVGDYGETNYTYDDTGQLTGADYASDWQDDESYVYDDNGNRTLVDGTTSYTTGDHNRLTSDGTYNYTYDGEGNVLTKTNISTGESVEYTWDHRNRLTKVTYKNSGGTATKIVEYAYDYGQRWVRKTLDTDGDGTIESSRLFVHDSGQIVLDFEKTGTGDAANSDLSHRYLWDPTNVDAIVADETVDGGTADDVAWTLTDHLNSVRDLVVYDPVTQIVSVVKHVVYDAYGNVTSDTATGVESLFLYTARPFDLDTGLQNNLNRWYDSTTGRWLSTDPIGFEAGDVNLYRYCNNSVLMQIDPSGTVDRSGMTTLGFVRRSQLLVDYGTPDDGHQIDFLGLEPLTKEQKQQIYLQALKQNKVVISGFNTTNVATAGGTFARFFCPVAEPYTESGMCRVKFHINGYIVGLVPADNNPGWKDFEGVGLPKETPIPEKVRFVMSHELDHLTTYEEALSVIVGGLERVEALEFTDADFCNEVAAVATEEAMRIWHNGAIHSEMFDLPERFGQGMYSSYPFIEVFSLGYLEKRLVS